MDSEALWSTIGKIVTAFGGVSLIIVLVSRWLSGRLADKLHLKWKHEYDKELENLRNQLTIMQGLINTALSSASQAHIVSQQRIIRAVDAGWGLIVRIHDYAFKFLFMYELLLPEEYDDVFSKPGLRPFLPRGSVEDFSDQYTGMFKLHEKYRPFLGERLWTLLWIYRAAIGRLCMKLVRERDRGHFYAWHLNDDGTEDTYLVDLLRNVLSEDEIRLAKERAVGGHSLLMILLEQKILLEADRRISGRHIADVTVEEGMKLAKLLSQTQKLP